MQMITYSDYENKRKEEKEQRNNQRKRLAMETNWHKHFEEI